MVYRYCRPLFDGANAQLRGQKSILSVLQTRQESIPFLTERWPLTHIAFVVGQLLKRGVFESPANAIQFLRISKKALLPISKKSAASDQEVARSKAKALDKPSELFDKEGVIVKSVAALAAKGKVRSMSKEPGADGVAVVDVATKTSKSTTSVAPFLHSIYISYELQHRMLTSIQSSLEECCFDFGKKWLPDIITSEGWEVPKEVELTTWIAKLSEHQKKIPTCAAFGMSGSSWDEIVTRTHELRNSTVHRGKISVHRLVDLTGGVAGLACVLKDISRAQWIEGFREDFMSSIEEMERDRNSLGERQSALRQRTKLAALEFKVMKRMIQNDVENEPVTSQGLTERLIISGTRLKIEHSGKEPSKPS
ncbi:hypothetical protein MMC22_010560 [Lobaria immixta]|nr:hypothetical protein [Lobaria immixta]